jgi:hypothetical protein
MNKYFLIAILVTLNECKPASKPAIGRSPYSSGYEKTDDTKPQIKNENFDSLLIRSGLDNKKLFLVFTFRGCSICKIFENYHDDIEVRKILERYLILRKIDVSRTPGGNKLYETYGKIGFPSWCILDSDRKVIADSRAFPDGSGNIGYPHDEVDRKSYIDALKKAAPSLKMDEIRVLEKKLKQYRPDRSE